MCQSTAHRLICDYVTVCGGVANVPINSTQTDQWPCYRVWRSCQCANQQHTDWSVTMLPCVEELPMCQSTAHRLISDYVTVCGGVANVPINSTQTDQWPCYHVWRSCQCANHEGAPQLFSDYVTVCGRVANVPITKELLNYSATMLQCVEELPMFQSRRSSSTTRQLPGRDTELIWKMKEGRRKLDIKVWTKNKLKRHLRSRKRKGRHYKLFVWKMRTCSLRQRRTSLVRWAETPTIDFQHQHVVILLHNGLESDL